MTPEVFNSDLCPLSHARCQRIGLEKEWLTMATALEQAEQAHCACYTDWWFERGDGSFCGNHQRLEDAAKALNKAIMRLWVENVRLLDEMGDL